LLSPLVTKLASVYDSKRLPPSVPDLTMLVREDLGAILKHCPQSL